MYLYAAIDIFIFNLWGGVTPLALPQMTPAEATSLALTHVNMVL